MTNFERITESPLRLAQFLQLRIDCYYCPARIDGIRNCETVCKEVLHRWLEEESKIDP